MSFLRGLPVDVDARDRRRGAGVGVRAARLPGGARPRRGASPRAASGRTSSSAALAGDRRRARRRARASTGRSGRAAEVGDGVYTGPPRAAAVRPGEGGRAQRSSLTTEGDRPRESTAYSDSHERRPVPRGRRPSRRGEPGPGAPRNRGRARLARAPVQRQGVPARDDARRGTQAAGGDSGFDARRCRRRSSRTSQTRTARQGRPRTLPGRLARDARPRSGRPSAAHRVGGRASSAGTDTARSAISCSRRSCARRSPIRPSARASSSRGGASRRACSATGCAGSPRAGSSRRSRRRRHGVSRTPTAVRRSPGRTLLRSRSRRATECRSWPTSRWAQSPHGDVLAGDARPEELVPFGGEHSHKAFALAVGLELLVSALAGPEHGAVLVVARPDHDPVPALRALAGGRRLPGDR